MIKNNPRFINKIHNENCLETMKKMEDNFVDVIVTSPPYNMGKGRKNAGGKIQKNYVSYSDDLSIDEYFHQTKEWLDEMLRVTKHHVFYNIQELKGNKGIVKFLLNEYESQLKDTFIWCKPNPPCSLSDTIVARGFEYIFCFSKDRPHLKIFDYCNFSNKNGDYMKNSIIKPVNSGKENAGHGYAFGDWLPKHFINYFSKKGDLIYDPFMGSGTTAKAAALLDRNWIGSEISKEYIEIANKRLVKYLTQTRMF
jgi:DNA modification methylase